MDYQKALNLAANLCSKKEYCCSDIRRKLLLWEISPEDSERILGFLKKNKFIDESRFAAFYARDKFRFNRWGEQKIAQMLKQKGIAPDMISEALTSLNAADYRETCLTLLKQKQKSIKDTDPVKIKAKLFRFCLSRGFDYNTIQHCYNQLMNSKNL